MPAEVQVIDKPVFAPGQIDNLTNMRVDLAESLSEAKLTAEAIQSTIERLSVTVESAKYIEKNGVLAPAGSRAGRPQPAARRIEQARPQPVRAQPTASNGDISGPMQKILNELAELEAVGISPADKAQLGLFCGYTNIKSGGFTGPLGKLREMELIHYPGSGEVALTDKGRQQAVLPGEPLTTNDLQSRIVNKLDGPRARVLRELIGIYPNAIGKEELGGKLGYTNVKSGGFTGPLGSLRKLGLIEYPQSGTVSASELLFPSGLA